MINKIYQAEIATVFSNWVISLVKAELSLYKESAKIGTQVSTDEWLTIEGACKHLKVSKPTLWEMSKRGVVSKYYLDGKPRYKKSDLDMLFLKISYGKELGND